MLNLSAFVRCLCPLVLQPGDAHVGSRAADDVPPLFRAGQKARVLNNHPTGHTRAPRYARGKIGIVERDHGVFVFADENAKGQGHRLPQHIYGVKFPAQELWGPNVAANDCVLIDLWDGHLEAAD